MNDVSLRIPFKLFGRDPCVVIRDKKNRQILHVIFSATTAEHNVTLTHDDNFLPIMAIIIVVVIECAFGMDLFHESIVVFLYRFLVRVKNVKKTVRIHTVASNSLLRAYFGNMVWLQAVIALFFLCADSL